MARRKKSNGRRAFGSIATLTRDDGTEVHRARYSCRVCQAQADEAWREASLLARMKGEDEPKRPRIVHHGSWEEDKRRQVRWLEDIAAEQAAYDRDWESDSPAFATRQCAWKDLREEQGVTRSDVETWGEPLRTFAQEVLERKTGAEATRLDDSKMWHEEHPLGLGNHFGHRPVRTITRADIRSWLRETEARPGRRGGTISPSAVRQRFYLLRRILAVAIDAEAIETDPSATLRPPALPQGRAASGTYRGDAEDRFLPSEGQMKQIVECLEPPVALAVSLGFGAGMRPGEVTALLRNDLERMGPQRWRVSISKSESQRGARTRSGGKTAGARGVRALPEWVGEVVEEHLEKIDLQPGDRLFPSLIGSAASLSHSAIKSHLRAACADLGYPEGITLQDLRAAGEQHVASLTSRPEAAAWARHGLGTQLAHYVSVETERASERAAGWQ